MKKIKVYRMNDCDWVAAASLEEAKQCLADMVSDGKVDADFEDEFCDDPSELSDEAMERLKYAGEEGALYEKPITFRQELEQRIKNGDKFPQFFASTEY